MRILYYKDLVGTSPNGIVTYLRNFIKYADKTSFEYWCQDVENKSVLIGPNLVALRKIPFIRSNLIPSRLKMMLAIRKLSTDILKLDSPVILNVNEHVAAFPKTTKKTPIIFISHGSNHLSIIPFVGKWHYVWQRCCDNIAVKKASKIITVSKQAQDVFMWRYPEHGHKIAYFPTFYDDELESMNNSELRKITRKDLSIGEETFVITYAGRLAREKQIDLAIKAFKILLNRYDDLIFLIIGSGPELSKLTKITRDLGIQEKVLFLKGCDNRRTAQMISASDCAILLSAFEGTSLFMLESLAVGIPLVALNVADHAEIIGDECGYVLRAKASPNDIAEKLDKLRKEKGQHKHNIIERAQYYKSSLVVPKILQHIAS